MNEGEQYSLDMALLKIREEKRKRKMRSERAVILFVVWLLVFRVCGIMRVDGNSMRPAWPSRGYRVLPAHPPGTAWAMGMPSS